MYSHLNAIIHHSPFMIDTSHNLHQLIEFDNKYRLLLDVPPLKTITYHGDHGLTLEGEIVDTLTEDIQSYDRPIIQLYDDNIGNYHLYLDNGEVRYCTNLHSINRSTIILTEMILVSCYWSWLHPISCIFGVNSVGQWLICDTLNDHQVNSIIPDAPFPEVDEIILIRDNVILTIDRILVVQLIYVNKVAEYHLTEYNSLSDSRIVDAIWLDSEGLDNELMVLTDDRQLYRFHHHDGKCLIQRIDHSLSLTKFVSIHNHHRPNILTEDNRVYKIKKNLSLVELRELNQLFK